MVYVRAWINGQGRHEGRQTDGPTNHEVPPRLQALKPRYDFKQPLGLLLLGRQAREVSKVPHLLPLNDSGRALGWDPGTSVCKADVEKRIIVPH